MKGSNPSAPTKFMSTRWMWPTKDADCPICKQPMWVYFVPIDEEIEGKAAKAHGVRGKMLDGCPNCDKDKVIPQ
jgi:hypothetical protein